MVLNFVECFLLLQMIVKAVVILLAVLVDSKSSSNDYRTSEI